MNSKTSQIWLEYFDSFAESYTEYKKKFQYYWNEDAEYINYFLNDENSILEIGCGTGETLASLRGKDKVGLDFSPEMINKAKSLHPEADFHVMDANDLSFSMERTFDVIVLSNVVGYFDNVLSVFNEIKKCCHDRTKVFVSYYSRLWQPLLSLAEFLGVKKRTPIDQNWLSQHDIQNLFFLAGFDAFRQASRILIPFKIPVVSYVFNKILANLPIFNLFCLSQYVFAKPMGNPSNDNPGNEYKVSVIVPARNESGNIERAVKETPEMGAGTELIFIEGNSTDDTWETIQKVYEENKHERTMIIDRQDGKGKYDAVKKGFDIACGDILMILDGDLTVPPEDLNMFYNAIVTGKGEFINGSRLVYPMEKGAMRFLNMLGNKFFSYAFSWLLGQPIKDTLCGTKVVFRKDYELLAANRKYFGDFDPFGDFDLLFGAYKLNLKIIDLPIRYRERTYGDTNISRFKHGIILLRMCAFALRKIKFI